MATEMKAMFGDFHPCPDICGYQVETVALFAYQKCSQIPMCVHIFLVNLYMLLSYIPKGKHILKNIHFTHARDNTKSILPQPVMKKAYSISNISVNRSTTHKLFNITTKGSNCTTPNILCYCQVLVL